MCGWIIQAHQTYTKARVAACRTVDLEAAGGVVYPTAAMPPGLPEDTCEEILAAIFGANMETQLTAENRAITKRSPILGKLSDRFSHITPTSTCGADWNSRKILLPHLYCPG